MKKNRKNKMALEHFALFSKMHYEWPKENRDHDDNMWKSVEKCLIADDYMPQTRHDIIHILTMNIVKYHGKKDRTDFMLDMLNKTRPESCYQAGYFTQDYFLAKGYLKKVKYDYNTALLYYFIHSVKFMKAKSIYKLPKPDKNVLPLRKEWYPKPLA